MPDTRSRLYQFYKDIILFINIRVIRKSSGSSTGSSSSSPSSPNNVKKTTGERGVKRATAKQVDKVGSSSTSSHVFFIKCSLVLLIRIRLIRRLKFNGHVYCVSNKPLFDRGKHWDEIEHRPCKKWHKVLVLQKPDPHKSRTGTVQYSESSSA